MTQGREKVWLFIFPKKSEALQVSSSRKLKAAVKLRFRLSSDVLITEDPRQLTAFMEYGPYSAVRGGGFDSHAFWTEINIGRSRKGRKSLEYSWVKKLMSRVLNDIREKDSPRHGFASVEIFNPCLGAAAFVSLLNPSKQKSRPYYQMNSLTLLEKTFIYWYANWRISLVLG